MVFSFTYASVQGQKNTKKLVTTFNVFMFQIELNEGILSHFSKTTLCTCLFPH